MLLSALNLLLLSVYFFTAFIYVLIFDIILFYCPFKLFTFLLSYISDFYTLLIYCHLLFNVLSYCNRGPRGRLAPANRVTLFHANV